jgi:hypothetical protein
MAKIIERGREATTEPADGIVVAKAELCRRFGLTGGSTARAEEYALVMPHLPATDVERALQDLSREGVVQEAWLGDGSAVYHFPRR